MDTAVPKVEENIVRLDEFLTIFCSDGKGIFLGRHRLEDLEYFKTIFRDEPELKEIKVVHTQKEILAMLEFLYGDNDEDGDVKMLSMLLHYYLCDINEACNLIATPKHITLINPGSEVYFKEAIIKCYKDNEHRWPTDLNFTDKIKSIIYDHVMNKPKTTVSNEYVHYVINSN